MDKKERPPVLRGSTTKVRTGHGNLYVIVNLDPSSSSPFEVFAPQGKAGSCDSAQMEATTRLISLCLQYGLPLEEIVKQLSGITCHPLISNGIQNKSPIDAISLILKEYLSKERE